MSLELGHTCINQQLASLFVASGIIRVGAAFRLSIFLLLFIFLRAFFFKEKSAGRRR